MLKDPQLQHHSFQKSVADAFKCLLDVFSSSHLSFLQTSPNGGCFVLSNSREHGITKVDLC